MVTVAQWVEFLTSGITVGCVYAAVGLGFVLVARVTNVYNFAQGAYVMIGAIVYAGESQAGLPQAPAILLALAAAVAVAVFQLWITNAGSGSAGFNTAVSSLGYSLVLEAFALWIWGSYPLSAPGLTGGVVSIFNAPVANQEFWVWGVTAITVVGVGAGFRYTHLGRAMQATSLNSTAARLSGISPKRMAVLAFALAGLLGGLLGVVTAPVTLASYNAGLNVGLVGFIAVALGDFRFPIRVIVGGLGLGILEAIAGGTLGSTYQEVSVYAVLLVWVIGRDLVGVDWRRFLRRTMTRGSSGANSRRSVERPRGVWLLPSTLEPPTPGAATSPVARLMRLLATAAQRPWPLVLVLVAVLVPLVSQSAELQGAATIALLGAIGATGLSLLMGIAGQLSLGQGVFYLIGGYGFALLVSVHGWNIWLAIGVGIALAGVLGWVIGALTLRLHGLNLALVTLAVDLGLISLISQMQSVTGGTLGTSAINNAKIVPLLHIGSLDLSSTRAFYYLCLVVLLTVMLLTRNLTRSAMGRALMAAGADETAAAASRVGATHLRLVAFTISAIVGGAAGALWASYLGYAVPSSWNINLSMQLIIFAVVGGLGTVFGGAVGAASISALIYIVGSHIAAGSDFGSAVNLFISGGLLIVFLRFWPGGIAAGLGSDAVLRGVRWLRTTLGGARGRRPRPAGATLPVDSGATGVLHGAPVEGRPGPLAMVAPVGRCASDQSGAAVLAVEGLAKEFGAISAVDHVSFDLWPKEIVALIGPNGAGKSTVINMLSGILPPTAGKVRLGGASIVGLRSEQIARQGLARTFQTPRTFGGMTVAESVMLALESAGRPSLFRAMLRTPGIRRSETENRRQAGSLLEFLDVPDQDRQMSLLTAGEQRLAEVARALAIEPLVLLLDEPAAGLNDTETEALGNVLLRVSNTGIAILLVEHDMNLVMSVADRVMVLEQGAMIAAGTPEVIAHDERVQAAYMGNVEI
jgi:branched-chain amino acid transport system permease protein